MTIGAYSTRIAAEAITQGDLRARAAIVTLEIIGEPTPQSRAGYVTAEVTSNLTVPMVASVVVLEVLALTTDPKPYIPNNEVKWTLKPDWTNGVTERLHWMTDVMTSVTGVEQRRKVRRWPRRDIEAQYTFLREKRRLYDSYMKGPSNTLFRVPLWWDKFVLTDVAIAGESFLSADMANGEYNEGDTLVLIGDTPWTYEYVQMQAINTPGYDGMQLKNTLQYTWPAGTTFYFTRLCRISTSEPTGNRKSDDAYQVTITFETAETNVFHPILDNGYVTIDFVPVWTDFPDDSNDLTSSYVRLYGEFDNMSGLPMRRDLGLTAFRVSQFAHWLHGRGQMIRFRFFLYYLQGMLNPLYIPTHFRDMELLGRAVIDPGTTHIFIDRSGYSDLVGNTVPDRKYIGIFYRDGTFTLHTILVNSVTEPLIEAIVFTDPVTRTISPATVKRVCYMELSRMDSDSIEILHQTDTMGVAQVTTAWRSISTVVPRYNPEYDISYTGVYTKNADPPALPLENYIPDPPPDPAPVPATDYGQYQGTGGEGDGSGEGDSGADSNSDGGSDGSAGGGGGSSGGDNGGSGGGGSDGGSGGGSGSGD